MHVTDTTHHVDASRLNDPALRIWEIDGARGLAVVLMVFYHLVWDLAYFDFAGINVFSLGWQTFARSIGTAFIFLSGVALVLWAGRRAQPWPRVVRYTLHRGGLLFGLGMVITLATYAFAGQAYVRFGILHLLVSALILATPFLYLPISSSVVAGLLLIGGGFALNQTTVSFPWLIWLGVLQSGVAMVDYYPVLPWFGVTLLGIATGRMFYPHGKRRIGLSDLSRLPPLRGLIWLGRHSLAIYLVHQPALIGVLFLIQNTLGQ
ncbi:MAG: DUF1624 domain-containing protein [Chloroflexales bacterium]|nr:DUF1624 domain-containing protein [Chloroflexales bacterium]